MSSSFSKLSYPFTSDTAIFPPSFDSSTCMIFTRSETSKIKTSSSTKSLEDTAGTFLIYLDNSFAILKEKDVMVKKILKLRKGSVLAIRRNCNMRQKKACLDKTIDIRMLMKVLKDLANSLQQHQLKLFIDRLVPALKRIKLWMNS